LLSGSVIAVPLGLVSIPLLCAVIETDELNYRAGVEKLLSEADKKMGRDPDNDSETLDSDIDSSTSEETSGLRSSYIRMASENDVEVMTMRVPSILSPRRPSPSPPLHKITTCTPSLSLKPPKTRTSMISTITPPAALSTTTPPLPPAPLQIPTTT
jgi:hypothetical protein